MHTQTLKIWGMQDSLLTHMIAAVGFAKGFFQKINRFIAT